MPKAKIAIALGAGVLARLDECVKRAGNGLVASFRPVVRRLYSTMPSVVAGLFGRSKCRAMSRAASAGSSRELSIRK